VSHSVVDGVSVRVTYCLHHQDGRSSWMGKDGVKVGNED
jgi:hypothetical protein